MAGRMMVRQDEKQCPAVGTMMASLAEALALAEHAGLSQDELLEVLSLGAMANPMFKLKARLCAACCVPVRPGVLDPVSKHSSAYAGLGRLCMQAAGPAMRVLKRGSIIACSLRTSADPVPAAPPRRSAVAAARQHVMRGAQGPGMVVGAYPPAFPLKHQLKDLRLALELGAAAGQPLPVAAAARQLYEQARARAAAWSARAPGARPGRARAAWGQASATVHMRAGGSGSRAEGLALAAMMPGADEWQHFALGGALTAVVQSVVFKLQEGEPVRRGSRQRLQ